MNEIKVIKAEHIQLRHDADGAQVVVLPSGFEFPEGKVSLLKEGDRVIIEPEQPQLSAPKTWAEFLDNLEPVDVEWPDVDEGFLPLDDIVLE